MTRLTAAPVAGQTLTLQHKGRSCAGTVVSVEAGGPNLGGVTFMLQGARSLTGWIMRPDGLCWRAV